jgi:hypothetical protein
VQPGVDAVKPETAPCDELMALKAAVPINWTSELAVGAAHAFPVVGEAVTAAGATAGGGADHMNRPSPHPGLY